ncbi:recombinase RecT [Candidatus Allofournierella merdipullorum]|uniref:recombinase RecT n=1 Tax=Candidatus Allofournierella merdipullorum TaxID=2838595 RepID=UPI00374F09BF
MNEMQTKPQKMPFSLAITTKGYNEMISRSIRDPKDVKRFVAAITSAVAVNPALQDCDPATILSGALLGNSLGLSPSPQLGQYYLVPYWNKKKGCNDAQFQLGYKGYVQLALRSGYYKHLNVIAVKAGEMVRFDPLTEDVDFRMIEDEEEREKAATVGYLATFEYLNGFRKTIYWSKEKMLTHADKYSPAFSKDAQTVRGKGGNTYRKVSFADYEAGNYPKQDEWMYSSFWYKNFDAMAFKTMLRQLISKWGIMSIELQTAFEQDTVVNEDYMEPADALTPAPVELPEPELVHQMPADAPADAEEVVNLNDL